MEAFRRSLQTWKSWALQNFDPERTFIFFRSYSPVHFRQVSPSKYLFSSISMMDYFFFIQAFICVRFEKSISHICITAEKKKKKKKKS
jgi:hypothetical protein